MSDSPASFGELLRRLRGAAALSQEELAERAGLSRNGISNLERGRHPAPRPETVRLLADALALQEPDRATLLAAVRPAGFARDRSGPSPLNHTSLPAPLTRLIGRETERAAVHAGLLGGDVRLLTLTGPGGVGKTRLAIAAAVEMVEDVPHGVVFVDLAPLTDRTLLPATVARALGIVPTSGAAIEEELARYLRPRQTLLLLDNCEHLLPAVAALVSRLLGSCSALQVLATSRTPLRVRGEQQRPVDPLPLPPDGVLLPLDRIGTNESIRLFVERARAVSPGFALDVTNASAVAEICRRVDGLPLAIELAAARITVLPPTALVAKLERPLVLLTGGERDLPTRQQTMRDTIAWSYDLLSPVEQVLFRQLAVFVGGFTLAAAQAVVETSERTIDVFEGIASLVNSSLLRLQADDTGEPRYRMLETVRQYGLELLEQREEVTAARDHHAAWCLDLVTRLDAVVVPYLPDGLVVLDRLEAEHPNLRAGLEWFTERDHREPLLRLAGALSYFWQLRGHAKEGRTWLERALALSPDVPTGARAAALYGLATMLFTQGEEDQALGQSKASAKLAREAEDLVIVALATSYAGLLAHRLGRDDRLAAYEQETLTAFAALPDAPWVERGVSHVFSNLGFIALQRGDFDAAEGAYAAALARQEALGAEPGATHVFATYSLLGLGDVARGRGDRATALVFYQTGLGSGWRAGDARAVAYGLGGVAGTLAAAGQWQHGARLFGATEALCERAGLSFRMWAMDGQRALGLPEPWQRADESFGVKHQIRMATEGCSTVVLAVLPDPAAAETAWTDGRDVSIEQAVTKALAAELLASSSASELLGP